MQGTVRDWDPATRDGRVLLDDGTELTFPGSAVQVRALRQGQRVQLQLSGGAVTALTIASLPFT